MVLNFYSNTLPLGYWREQKQLSDCTKLNKTIAYWRGFLSFKVMKLPEKIAFDNNTSNVRYILPIVSIVIFEIMCYIDIFYIL